MARAPVADPPIDWSVRYRSPAAPGMLAGEICARHPRRHLFLADMPQHGSLAVDRRHRL
jgi:hypothetical protein